MSGPVTDADAPLTDDSTSPEPPVVEVIHGRNTMVGGMGVRRTLPHRGRRTIGAWCFVDHFGPADVDERGMAVGPHPHIGLATVTWLLEGRVLHRDSIGSLQEIRPGQLNVMHAGHGVVHSEEGVDEYVGVLHGAQLWVAQPEVTRHSEPAFEHHPELPVAQLPTAAITVLMGELAGLVSPARADTPLVGAELSLAAGVLTVELNAGFEHGVVVLDGSALVDGVEVKPGELAYLGVGRASVSLDTAADTRALLLGGEPFEADPLMWWNFVARDRSEIGRAFEDWQNGAERFSDLRLSPLARIPAPRPSWLGPAQSELEG